MCGVMNYTKASVHTACDPYLTVLCTLYVPLEDFDCLYICMYVSYMRDGQECRASETPIPTFLVLVSPMGWAWRVDTGIPWLFGRLLSFWICK